MNESACQLQNPLAPRGCHHRVLSIALVFVIIFAIVEALGGYVAHSLALLSDAGHMAADALSLVIAAFAAWIAQKPPSPKHTFGLARAEVIAASLSSLILIALAIGIAWEALSRLKTPEVVSGPTVIIIAILGLIVNLVTAWILHRGEKNFNIQAAFLHVLSDLLGSVVALIAGIVIYFTDWMPIDPLLSLLICGLILWMSFRLLKNTVSVLMEGAPIDLSLSTIEKALMEIPGIKRVNDLHVWTLSSQQRLLTAHVQIENLENWQTILNTAHAILKNQFHLSHITIEPTVL